MSYHWAEQKLIFLAQPRTGSHAVAEWLCGRGAMMVGKHHEFDRAKLAALRQDGWRSFSVVRNHWDALVSWWYMHRARRSAADFESFVRWWVNEQTYLRPHRLYWNYQPVSDEVLRYEALDAEMSALVGEDVTLPRMNVTATRYPYLRYYERHPGLAEFVAEWFAEEIEQYGYEF